MPNEYEDLAGIITGLILQEDPKKTVLYIIHKNPEYVVYEIKETGQITYKTSSTFVDHTYEIAMKLDKVESFLGENPTLWLEYKNTMADIYLLYLSNSKEKQEAAKKLLEQVASEIQYNKYSKVYYLLPCLVAVTLMCILSMVFKTYNYTHSPSFYSVDYHVVTLIYMMTFGAIGGLLSIAIYIDKHEEKFSRFMIQRVYAGLFRILIAMLSGLIIYILFRSDLVTGFTEGSNNFLKYALAIISGFSQNLVPNLANKSDQKITGESTVTKEKQN